MPPVFRRKWVVAAGLITLVVSVLSARLVAIHLVMEGGHQHIQSLTQSFAASSHDQYSEIIRVIDSIEALDTEFCSDEELIMLRKIEFGSLQVADVGRIHEQRLVCTTTIGRLEKPIAMAEPDYVTETGMRWFTDTPLLASDSIRTLILESGNTNVVIDQNSVFDDRHPELLHAVLAIDLKQNTVLHVVGDDLPISIENAVDAYLFRQDPWAFDGYVGTASCHNDEFICVISMYPMAPLLEEQSALVASFSTVGGVAGLGCLSFILLFFQHHHSIASRLRRAIRKDQLDVHYQPQVNILSGKIVGAEALIRWTDETGHFQRPDVFVAEAEQHGFISQLTNLVIRHALREMRSHIRSNPDFHLSINFSAHDLENTQLVERLTRLAAEAEIPIQQLTIELTERAAGSDAVKSTLKTAREAGFRVAIDDFGIGYSSLSCLQAMPIDYLKVDKSFTDTIGTGSVRATIVPQILDMARTLNLDVVVEGVETEDQVNYLQERSVPVVQGWVYGRAMSVEDFGKWCRKWNGSACISFRKSA